MCVALVLWGGVVAAHALADDGIPCDPGLIPGTGSWSVRWGGWVADTLEPAFHVRCAPNDASARLTTALLNASVLEWPGPAGTSTTRRAEVSFLVPDLDGWSHIAVLPAYEPGVIGRIGADIFHETRPDGGPRDRVTIQFNLSADVGCGVGNLHEPVPISGGIAAGRWYRLSARVELRRDGGLRVSGVVRDLDAGNTLVGATRFDAPATCTPSWFPATSGWGVGVLGLETGVDTYLDDFAAFTEPPPPATVDYVASFDDAALPPELGAAVDDGFAASAADGELAITAAPDATGEAVVAATFRAVGDFAVTVAVRRDALATADAVGVRLVSAETTRAVALAGPDAIVASDGSLELARRDDDATLVRLRLTRTAGVLAATADSGGGFVPLAVFPAAGDGESRIELFARRSAPNPSAGPLVAGFDDLAIAAEQLAVGAASPLALTSYRSVWALGTPRFVGFGPVDLVDVLGRGTYDVAVPRMLAAPATSAQGIDALTDPTAFLVEYPLAASKGAVAFVARAARVVDGCDDVAVQIRKPLGVLVPSTTAFPPEPPAIDHFVCYQASAVPAAAGLVKGRQVDVADAVQTRRYDLGRVTKVCNPVDKSGDPVLRTGPQRGTPWPIEPATVRDREPHLVCYAAKAAKRRIEQDACGPRVASDRGVAIAPAQPAPVRSAIVTTNQLGRAPLNTLREAEVCLPAVLVVPTE